MRKFRVKVDGEEYIVEVEEIGQEEREQTRVAARERINEGTIKGNKKNLSVKKEKRPDPVEKGSGVTAPMPGKILEIMVKPGQEVERGEVLIVLEAMKLENNITAPHAGKIKEVLTQVGTNVEAGDLLLKFE